MWLYFLVAPGPKFYVYVLLCWNPVIDSDLSIFHLLYKHWCQRVGSRKYTLDTSLVRHQACTHSPVTLTPRGSLELPVSLNMHVVQLWQEKTSHREAVPGSEPLCCEATALQSLRAAYKLQAYSLKTRPVEMCIQAVCLPFKRCSLTASLCHWNWAVVSLFADGPNAMTPSVKSKITTVLPLQVLFTHL